MTESLGVCWPFLSQETTEMESIGRTAGRVLGAAGLCMSFGRVLIARSRVTFRDFLFSVFLLLDMVRGGGRQPFARESLALGLLPSGL